MRLRSGYRLMSVADRPAGDHARCRQTIRRIDAFLPMSEKLTSWFPSRTSKLTPRSASQDFRRSRSTSCVRARPSRFEQVACDNQSQTALHRSSKVDKPSECFFKRMGNHTVARSAPGPFISQVNVGDDGGSLAQWTTAPSGVNCQPSRMGRLGSFARHRTRVHRQSPSCCRRTSRACNRRRACRG